MGLAAAGADAGGSLLAGGGVHVGQQHIDVGLGSQQDCFLCAAAAGDDRDIWKAKFKCADKELAIEGLVLHEENSYRRH